MLTVKKVKDKDKNKEYKMEIKNDGTSKLTPTESVVEINPPKSETFTVEAKPKLEPEESPDKGEKGE